MNNSNIAIKNPEDVCFNCLKETKVNKIYIDSLGYGSGFDNFSTRINLCDDCIKQTNKDWWKLEKKQCDWDDTPESEDNYNKFFKYKYEDEILAYVKQLPLAGQELFYSRFAYGICADSYMSGQDWIDYRLGILPHENVRNMVIFTTKKMHTIKNFLFVIKLSLLYMKMVVKDVVVHLVHLVIKMELPKDIKHNQVVMNAKCLKQEMAI